MTPEKFIALWKGNPLTERAGAQTHFTDLCDVLGVDKPRDPDNYCFERGAKKTAGPDGSAGDGWADVWKRGHFGWENKKPGRDLGKAFRQLTDYADNLDSPPLLVVSDRERIIIHTHFSGYPEEVRTIGLEELVDPAQRQILKWVFTDPEKLRPEKSTAAITRDAAIQFASIAKAIRERGQDGQEVAHFLVQCLFCMFAEDEKLLPDRAFTKLLKSAASDPQRAANRLSVLFKTMRKGGDYGDLAIAWFNGGLFKTVQVPPLTQADLNALHRAAADMDWRAIDPTIFGTLFENGLDPAQRAQLGANYTDTATIGKIIHPLITAPLLAEWAAVKATLMATVTAERGQGKKAAFTKAALAAYQGFLLRLNTFRVLDPACGSGNFLYLSLKALRDVEKLASVEARELGLNAELSMQTGPHNICGLEINEFAAELARVTVWIGDIQWCRRNGYAHATHPILKSLDTIEHRNALVNPDGSEAAWPPVDVIVGNPPFLGDKMMRGELGDAAVNQLRQRYEGRVPGGADLVTYWFEKARAQIDAGKCQRAGLVATNSIRQKRNRVVLERILQSTRIFEAWSDEDWVNDGAAVRVSIVCFGAGGAARLDGQPVAAIHADLSGSAQAGALLDLTQAGALAANKSQSFFGVCLAGPFKVDTATALAWLQSSGNPNGRPNSDVVRPIYNGSDITRRWAGHWVVDFAGSELAAAADYLAPFAHVEAQVKPVRLANKRAARAEKWWQHGEKRPGMRAALNGLTHYIATPETAKHRFFVKFAVAVAPEHSLIVIPRQDDVTLGLLSSRIHVVWALAKGGTLEDRPRYNSSLTFETFPFPPGFDLKAKTAPEAAFTTPDTVATPEAAFTAPEAIAAAPAAASAAIFTAIAAAALALQQWRESWLNPEGWVRWAHSEAEQRAGFPPRPVPVPAHAAEWKKRTLTALYNANPAGLRLRHAALDKAVAAAYGWSDYTPEMQDEEILRRLLALNLAAAPAQSALLVSQSDAPATKAPRKKKAKALSLGVKQHHSHDGQTHKSLGKKSPQGQFTGNQKL